MNEMNIPMMSPWARTPVYLGALDGKAPAVTYPQCSKVGGVPDWPSPDVGFDTRCGVCGAARPMLVQCHAPLRDSPFHRTLFVFACVNPDCWNNSQSWSCVRVQFLDSPGEDAAPAAAVASGDGWCADAEDWDRDEDEQDMDEIIAGTENMTFTNSRSRLEELQATIQSRPGHGVTAEIEADDSAETVRAEPAVSASCDLNALLTQRPALPAETTELIQFQCQYLSVYMETYSLDNTDKISELLRDYEKVHGTYQHPASSSSNETFAEEEYEEEIPLHGDTMFHSFTSVIKLNPEQVIRYSLNGDALLMSPLLCNPKRLKCSGCLGEMQFEMQILPTLIPQTKLVNSQETHLEFGTALIYSCKNSCWSEMDKFKCEAVILQQEP